jgi:hypothetical protein
MSSPHASHNEGVADGDIWAALVHIAPGESNMVTLGASDGVYTNALAWASDEHDFRVQVTKELGELGLSVEEFEDIGLVSEGSDRARVEDLALEVAETRSVRFTTFHVYGAEDAANGE